MELSIARCPCVNHPLRLLSLRFGLGLLQVALDAALLAGCSRDAGESRAAVVRDAGTVASLTEERRQRLVESIVPLVNAHYVFAELGAKATEAIRDHLARGDYAGITGEADFAQRLTDDLRAVTHDLHFRVRYRPKRGTEPMTPELRAKLAVEAKHGIADARSLPGGVGLLKIDSFLEPPETLALQQAYVEAMAVVADAPALILDLRDNYGGDPTTVAYVLSYFFEPQPVHVNDVWNREQNVTWQNWTRHDVPGKRFGGRKPMFVLVSHRTVSGGEEMAYDLQAQKRAPVLGEPTTGAANPAPPFDLGDDIRAFIPVARAINPITKANWEGTGVLPDLAVDPAQAVERARSMAGSRSSGLK